VALRSAGLISLLYVVKRHSELIQPLTYLLQSLSQLEFTAAPLTHHAVSFESSRNLMTITAAGKACLTVEC